MKIKPSFIILIAICICLSAIYPIIYHYAEKEVAELPEFILREEAIVLLAEGIQEKANEMNCKGYIIPIKIVDYDDSSLTFLKEDINLALSSYKNWQLTVDETTKKEIKKRFTENLSNWGAMLSGNELEKKLKTQLHAQPNYSSKAKVFKLKEEKTNDMRLIVYIYDERTSSEEFNVSVNFIHPLTLKQLEEKRETEINNLNTLRKNADISKKFILVFVTLFILYILTVFIIYLIQKYQIKKTKDYLLIEIEKKQELVDNGYFVTAFELAEKFLIYFPEHTEIKAFKERLLDVTNNDPKKAQVAYVEAKKLQLRITNYERESQKAFLTGEERNALVPLLQYNPELDSSFKRLVFLEEKEEKKKEFEPKFENIKHLYNSCKLKQAEQELLTLQKLYPGYSELIEYQKIIEQTQKDAQNKFSSIQNNICNGEIRMAKQTLDKVLNTYNDMPEALDLKTEFEEAAGNIHFILKPSGKEKEIEIICKDEVILGREDIDVKPDIVFNDRRISRPHLRISIIEDKVIAEDMGSACGSFINGEKIISKSLNDGDLLNLAKLIELQIHIYRMENGNIGGILITGNSKNYLIISTFVKFFIDKGNLALGKDNYSIYHQEKLTVLSIDKKGFILNDNMMINIEQRNYNVEVIK